MGQGNNQPPPTGPNAAEQAAMEQAILQGADMVGMMLAGFVNIPPESLKALAINSVRHQQALGAVLEDAVVPEKRAANPYWGFILRQQGVEVGRVMVPKDLNACKDAASVMHHATVVMLVSTPIGRALMQAVGIEIEFFQTKKPGPRLHLPS